MVFPNLVNIETQIPKIKRHVRVWKNKHSKLGRSSKTKPQIILIRTKGHSATDAGIFRAEDGRRSYCIFYMHDVASGKPPEQKWWCVTVGVVFDYVAVQSKAVMLLSHLDHISSGRNTCSCVCRIQSRHGNLDFIREQRERERIGCLEQVYYCICGVFMLFFPLSLCVLMHTIVVCSLTICLWVCELWKFDETNW